MKQKLTILSIVLTVFILSAFIQRFHEDDPVYVPPAKQRLGDAQKGLHYLVNGDYVRSGIPYKLFQKKAGKDDKNYLQRTGINETIPYQYTAVTAANGQNVVAPNCLQCHAQVFNDQLVIGLGNTEIDFTDGKKLNPKKIQLLENFLKATAPAQYKASAPFLTATRTIAPDIKAEVRGVNMASRLTNLLLAHRDPVTFRWSDEPLMPVPDEAIPTDTPPWWLLKKKNAMFYNALGRGDFGRFLMASNLITVNDTAESAQVDAHMPDVLAYLYSLEPPEFPKEINRQLADEGKILFENNCSECHGTYGEEESYPNLLIPASTIQTDSFLFKSNYSNKEFVDWFNRSWFTRGDHPAKLQPYPGYMAPPLDGIWITAPYLHNGSVPTLDALLNSKSRPRYWSRNFDKPEYDYDNVGWKFSVHDQPGGSTVYNTGLPGYGNYGHYFGDVLSDEERKAVIEYLKGL